MSALTPYRAPAVADRRAPPPETFQCVWEDRERSINPVAGYYAVSTGLVVLVVVAAQHRLVAGILAVTTALAVRVLRNRARDRGRPRVTVAAGMFQFTSPDGLPETVPLDHLLDLEVDSKAIQRVTWHQTAGMAVPTSQVSGAFDVARIELVLAEPPRRVLLTRTFASYSTCLEQFGRLRVFLRRHGWLPASERIPETLTPPSAPTSSTSTPR